MPVDRPNADRLERRTLVPIWTTNFFNPENFPQAASGRLDLFSCHLKRSLTKSAVSRVYLFWKCRPLIGQWVMSYSCLPTNWLQLNGLNWTVVGCGRVGCLCQLCACWEYGFSILFCMIVFKHINSIYMNKSQSQLVSFKFRFYLFFSLILSNRFWWSWNSPHIQ